MQEQKLGEFDKDGFFFTFDNKFMYDPWGYRFEYKLVGEYNDFYDEFGGYYDPDTGDYVPGG